MQRGRECTRRDWLEAGIRAPPELRKEAGRYWVPSARTSGGHSPVGVTWTTGCQAISAGRIVSCEGSLKNWLLPGLLKEVPMQDGPGWAGHPPQLVKAYSRYAGTSGQADRVPILGMGAPDGPF